jgi:hypothetical protein
LPATLLPSHAPNSLPIMSLHSLRNVRCFDAPRDANVPSQGLGFATNSWLGKSAARRSLPPFSLVLRHWHVP